MFGHDPYAARAVEYLLGLGFLLVFAAFWRYAAGEARSSVEKAAVRVRRSLSLGDLFQVPADVLFHPGHTWARAEAPDLVTVGVDDFAQQLVGPMATIETPDLGAALEQGAPVARLRINGAAADLLSPISGHVVAVNDDLRRSPHAVNEDPYGRGWLIKVRTPRWPIESKQLLKGSLAQRWMSSSWDDLTAMLSPELGTTMHDGGMPVEGLARAIGEEHWDEIARRFLLSEKVARPELTIGHTYITER